MNQSNRQNQEPDLDEDDEGTMTLREMLEKFTDQSQLLKPEGLEHFLYYTRVANYYPMIVETGLFSEYLTCLHNLFSFRDMEGRVKFWSEVATEGKMAYKLMILCQEVVERFEKEEDPRVKAELELFISDRNIDLTKRTLAQIHEYYLQETLHEAKEERFRKENHERILARIIIERKQIRKEKKLKQSYNPYHEISEPAIEKHMKITEEPVQMAEKHDKHWTSVKYDNVYEEGQIEESDPDVKIPITPCVEVPGEPEVPKQEEEIEDLKFLNEVDEWDNI